MQYNVHTYLQRQSYMTEWDKRRSTFNVRRVSQQVWLKTEEILWWMKYWTLSIKHKTTELLPGPRLCPTSVDPCQDPLKLVFQSISQVAWGHHKPNSHLRKERRRFEEETERRRSTAAVCQADSLHISVCLSLQHPDATAHKYTMEAVTTHTHTLAVSLFQKWNYSVSQGSC